MTSTKVDKCVHVESIPFTPEYCDEEEEKEKEKKNFQLKPLH